MRLLFNVQVQKTTTTRANVYGGSRISGFGGTFDATGYDIIVIFTLREVCKKPGVLTPCWNSCRLIPKLNHTEQNKNGSLLFTSRTEYIFIYYYNFLPIA